MTITSFVYDNDFVCVMIITSFADFVCDDDHYLVCMVY